MPEYEIEDSDTGLKVAVVGDSEPTADEAEALIQKEFNDIRTNLFQLPGNKWFLDVGPLYKNREYLDENRGHIGSAQRIGEVHEQAKQFAQKEWQREFDEWSKDRKAKKPTNWKSLYEAQVQRYNATNPPVAMPSIAEATLAKEPPGTIFIGAHGSRSSKNLSTEWGHEFTMQNLARLLGDSASGISNIVNAACYGASCEPKDYQAAFPAATTVRHINTNQSNIISMKGFREGQFFSGPEVSWSFDGKEWKQKK